MSREKRVPRDVTGEPIATASGAADLAQSIAKLLRATLAPQSRKPRERKREEPDDPYWRRYY